ARPPAIQPVRDANEDELSQRGHLAFLLIGEVHDTEIVETELGHAAFQQVTWDPTIPEVARIEPTRIVVKHTDDEEIIWNAVSELLTASGDEAPAQLRDALGIALDHLQDRAVARVVIPLPGQTIGFGITDSILVVLREQRDEYAAAVARYSSGLPDA